MSDCAVWGNTEWHAPNGRVIYVSEDDMPCEIGIVYEDGSTRWLHVATRGRAIDHIEVDGKRWVPVRERDWDDLEVTD